LKPTADLELASGVNRFVMHCSVHQPVNDKIPGIGLGGFGQWFTRRETWAGQAKPWTAYHARSSYMFQQGKCVAELFIIMVRIITLRILLQLSGQMEEFPKFGILIQV